MGLTLVNNRVKRLVSIWAIKIASAVISIVYEAFSKLKGNCFIISMAN